jgi:hypothetical protein
METEYFAVERLGVSAAGFVHQTISQGADDSTGLGTAGGQIGRWQSGFDFAAGVVIKRHVMNLLLITAL